MSARVVSRVTFNLGACVGFRCGSPIRTESCVCVRVRVRVCVDDTHIISFFNGRFSLFLSLSFFFSFVIFSQFTFTTKVSFGYMSGSVS